VVLLAAFGLVEARSRHALLPGRLLRDRGRLGANLIMLGVGTRQIGGAIGLAVLSTVAWTAAAGSARAHGTYRHALVTGFDRAFTVGAGIAVLILLITIGIRGVGTTGTRPGR
ncbi:MAG: hypothetical protein ACRDP6_46405, partial [Actinoallomurus sp.]